MPDLPLTKVSETATKITLGWTPVPGAVGYRFQSETQAPKWSHTFDPTRSQVTFSKADWYKVEALGVEAAGEYPEDEPPAGNLPAVITQGGTYSGTIKVSQSGPAVRIATSEPVVIEDAHIENLSDGSMLECVVSGADVTVRRTVFQGGRWRAINARGFRRFRVENCDVLHAWGCRFDNMQSGGSLHFLRNRNRNTQRFQEHPHFFQCANNPPGTIEVAWNESINEFGLSSSEDVISAYSSHNVKIHDNYVQGAYPESVGDGYSGGGIIVDGPSGSGTEIYDNIVVDTVNYGVAIAGGKNNTCRNNRAVSDGKAPNGQRFAAANIGLYVADFSSTPAFTGNQAFGNVIGWTKADGARNDSWTPGCQGQCSNSSLKSGAITQADKDAEWQRWLQKLAAAGVSVGV